MTLTEFSDVFAILAIQLRATDADEATIRVYFKALQDVDLAFVRAAAERMAERGGALDSHPHWFPKTSEWREIAETIRLERLEQQRAQLRQAREPVCLRCDDTGWEPLALVENGVPVRRVRACPCRDDRWRELTGTARPALPPRESA